MKLKKIFDVEINEIYQIKDVIEAESRSEALEKAKEKYRNGEYTFNVDSLVAAEFEVKDND